MYNKLVLSGGGKRGLLQLGSLQYIYDNIDMSNINTYIGTSIGSILCYFLIIGYTPIELLTLVCTTKIMKQFNNADLYGLFHGQSVFTNNFIHKFLIRLTLQKVNRVFTMIELYEMYNKEFVCTTYNITKNSVEYISYKNFPEMDCITALKMSANIPFLFDKIKYKDNYYVDGAFMNNFPINLVNKNDKVISINVTLKNVKIENNPITYLNGILCSIIYYNVKYNIIRNKNPNIIIIDMSDKDISTNINCSSVDILNIFCNAYEYTEFYYDKKLK
jgi:predicted acylesterase/phospholipase RssA